MSLLKNVVLLCLCFKAFLHAEWNPDFLCQQCEHMQKCLADKQYIDLKAQVSETLRNSWCSQEKINLLMDLTILTCPAVCVEVGVFTGSSILPVAASMSYLNLGTIYAVDAWSNAKAILHLSEDDPNRKWWSQVDMAAAYQMFRDLIEEWSLDRFCIDVCKSSSEAISEIPNQIDFLHLDGDYSETGALQDVGLYLPKVKSGGYILFSNLYFMVKREQPKIKAFCVLCETCDIVATIEKDNVVLFQKK